LAAKIKGIKDMRGLQILIWGILLTLVISCGSSTESGNSEPLRVNKAPEDMQVLTISIERFERDLFSFKKESFTNDTLRNYRQYGTFLDLFASKIIRVGNKSFPLFRENLLGFTNDPDIRSVYNEVQKQYPDLKVEEADLSTAFSRFHQAFPDTFIPRIYSMISGFNFNVVIADSSLGLALEMYLGDSCKFYELLALPKYKVDRMNRQQIVPDVVRAYLMGTFVLNMKENDLISRMVYEGQLMYLISQLLPQYEDARILAYSDAQIDWCEQNEGKIWAHFIDKKLFYSTDFNNEVAYVSDGPFSKGFPKEAPARIGVWLGFTIVKSFMLTHPEVTINELMEMHDAHQFFNTSGYKPTRS
jgi:hypothetical protein